ncbi:MAG: PVC-type heme-binding CxxCH protein [Pirellulaceae bacterium]
MFFSLSAPRPWSLVLAWLTFTALLAGNLSPVLAEEDKQDETIEILFLGDRAGHNPSARFRQFEPVMKERGIVLTYTEDLQDLNPKTLKAYDGLLIFANHTRISPEQEAALLEYVEAGNGLIPLHSASFCFLNSPKYIDLVGAQFQRHGAGVFRTTSAGVDHPVTRGFSGFESWDETYVHTKHNEEGRTVLEYRVDNEGREPWTWVREQGEGRVFYTAWGHDERTWGEEGFENLVERGIRWAVKRDPSIVPDYPPTTEATSAFDHPFRLPEMNKLPTDLPPLDYVDVGAKIPNYSPRAGQADPLNMMQLPLSPEDSMKRMVTPRDFRVELFASEEMFEGGKPIAMAWDEAGRLWVALTLDYPNELRPPGEGRDRLVVLEDTTGDGKADKLTQFADKLSVPTTLTFHNGGVIVQNAVETLFLKDENGNGEADIRQVMFSGWNSRDTHGGVSNFQYGLDNWIWAMQGYNDSAPAIDGQPTERFRMGFFRFRPDGSDLEFIRSTNNNTWGLGISEEGIVFGSTANRNPSVFMPIPNRYYETVRGWTPSLVLGSMADTHLFNPVSDKIRQVDHHGGYTAGAGHSLYTARRYPQEYWNRVALVNGPTGHLTGAFVIERDGSGFRSTNPFNLLASTDEWTAPIIAEVGPDGNVWIVDWYNYIVQHNPTPHGFETGKNAAYETDLRDKKHGRIYRVVYDPPSANGQPQERFSLKDAEPEKLVAALAHDNLLWRRHAQRLLVERGETDIVPQLLQLAADQEIDEIGLNVGVIHALWTLHGLGQLDSTHAESLAAAITALGHPSAGVRRNAVQVLPAGEAATEAILAAKLLEDIDPQVQLTALLALADQPASEAAGKAVVQFIADNAAGNDRWLNDASIAAAAKHDAAALSAWAQLKQVDRRSGEAIAIVSEHYARGGPVDSIASVLESLTKANPAVSAGILEGLGNGWPEKAKPVLTEALEEQLERMFLSIEPPLQVQLIRLAGSWGSERLDMHKSKIVDGLLAKIEDDQLDAKQRASAAADLVTFDTGTDTELLDRLMGVVSPRSPLELTEGVLSALRTSQNPAVGEMLLGVLPDSTPAMRKSVFSVLLSRPEWTEAMLDGVDTGEIQLTELALDQRQALQDHPRRDIRRRASMLLARGGALPNPDRQKVIDEWLSVTQEKGDAAAGKLVFTKQCAKCHMHSGEGSKVGPDLTGMAVHPKGQLLTEILDPSRSVEANYRTYLVGTVDGRVLSGLLAAESRTALEFFDAEGKRQTILRDDIEQLRATPKSLMPEGFEKQVTRQEMVDLLQFLATHDRYVPLPLNKVATAISDRGMFHSADAQGERLEFADWGPKLVDGVPFVLTDPQNGQTENVILLQSSNGAIPPKMPRTVELPANMPIGKIHLLSGVAGWAHPYGDGRGVSMIVRLHFEDGSQEDHELRNGVHFADYIRRVDVPGSKFAFDLSGRQIRYLAIEPKRKDLVQKIELVKGRDSTAPVVMAVTLEGLAK